jgi:hypothetical protein
MHHFIKTSLQKNPKKRPPAEKLLTVNTMHLDGGEGVGEGLVSAL